METNNTPLLPALIVITALLLMALYLLCTMHRRLHLHAALLDLLVDEVSTQIRYVDGKYHVEVRGPLTPWEPLCTPTPDPESAIKALAKYRATRNKNHRDPRLM